MAGENKVQATDKDASKRDAATDSSGREGEQSAEATEQAAARRPVQKSKGKSPGGANRARSGQANKGNRSARQVREQGANKKQSESESEKDEEEEEDDDKRAADNFWQYLVAASYSSRKARGDWGGGDEGE